MGLSRISTVRADSGTTVDALPEVTVEGNRENIKTHGIDEGSRRVCPPATLERLEKNPRAVGVTLEHVAGSDLRRRDS